MAKKIEKRATPHYGKEASHRTDKGTRKYQCQAPTEWEPLLKALVKELGGKREADAIRYALGKGLGVMKAKEPKVKKPKEPKVKKAKEPKVKKPEAPAPAAE